MLFFAYLLRGSSEVQYYFANYYYTLTDKQKIIKSFDFWLSGPHVTSNFKRQFLIYSDLNYTNLEVSRQVEQGLHRLVPSLLLVLGSPGHQPRD